MENFPNIVATKKEVESIRKIKNFGYQKLLFTMLIVAKRIKFSENKRHSEFLGYHLNKQMVHNISVDLNMKISLAKTTSLMREFFLLGMIEPSGGQNVKLLYAEDNSQPLIEVDGKNMKIYDCYVSYLGGDILFCEDCEKEMKRTSPNQKYCDNCKKIRNNK